VIHDSIGKHYQSYPPYSSRTVNGKPLYYWARQGKIHEITIPEKEIEIVTFNLISLKTVSKQRIEKIFLENYILLREISGRKK